jgi:hypothetical protein
LVFAATGMVAVASSCSNTPNGFGSSDGGYTIITESDGATFVATDGGLIPVTVSEAGVVSVAPGSDATLPPLPGADGSVSTGADGTVATGADGTVSTGSDATSDVAVTPLADGACPGAAAPVACNPTSTGGLSLASNYLPASDGIGSGGYAYAYSDSMNGVGGASTACIEATKLCAVGSVDVSNTSGSHYGAGIGFNLNQQQSTTCATTPITPYTITSSQLGISYVLSSLPNTGAGLGGLRLIIGNAVTQADGGVTGTDYCVSIGTASGTIPWSEFNSECWSGTGTELTQALAESMGPIHINIGVVSATTAGAFDFCVDSLAFATSVTTATIDASVSCGTSSCCEPSGGPSTTSGSLTCYTFNSAQPGGGTPGDKTYCGYQGSETAYTGSLTGACASNSDNAGIANVDTVPNVGPPSDYFAAFPGPGGTFGNGALCGLCVNVTYAQTGKTLMATVVDECPEASNPQCGIGSNHLDLSAALARDLGYGVNGQTGDPTGVSWSAVACPIASNDGNIVVVWNGSNTQVYFQNVVWPVKAVSTGTQNNGFWQLSSGTGSVTLTDMIGHQITGMLPANSGGSLGVQFPSTCTN